MEKFKRLNGIRPDREEMKRRKEHVKSIIIHHPKYNEILEQLEDMLYMSDGTVSPDQLFIYGTTGVGKSTVTKEFTNRHPSIIVSDSHRTYKHIPVLHVRVPPKATRKALASKILHQMGDPMFNKGTEVELTGRIHHFISELKMKMIILDEFQHLIDTDTDHVLATAANWVKTFSEESAIPIVLCGMPNSLNIFVKEEQLDRRYAYKEQMEAFNYAEADEIITFRAFINKVEEELPFADASNLADRKMADKLYYISLGVPFYIMKLLEFGTEVALKAGEDKITEMHLQIALRKIKQVSRPFRVNPFNMAGFNLEKELKKEHAEENRFKANLLGDKQRTRKKAKGKLLSF
ncbi:MULTISPECIES: TniB family NTP-binding protein [Paenibacillus]|uniref:TniB family NTP-binding protein n=1 Tax=Paenibacillus TaxID=44249 RepID=UPI0011A447C0|nr:MULTISPECIES: TniB family NTP-binding protein [Paenibacillus]MBJ9989265.1 TniB family NTP-binding protein [Paenibacillus sp. S28]